MSVCGCSGVCRFNVRAWRKQAVKDARVLRVELSRQPAPRVFAWAPLERFVLARCEGRVASSGHWVDPGPREIAAWLGIDRRQVHRFRTRGVIDEPTADLLLTRAGWGCCDVPGWDYDEAAA